MMVLRLCLDNFHFRASFIFIKHFAATMITGTEVLELHVRSIRCVEGVVNITRGIVCILGLNSPTIDTFEANVDK